MANPRGEQRLAAILAADVAGYSRLMEADERATVATLVLTGLALYFAGTRKERRARR